MSYFENQANEARRDLSDIEMNGGIGSSAYYDAQNRIQAARLNHELYDPKPSNPFGAFAPGSVSTPNVATGPFAVGPPARTGPRRRHTARSLAVLLPGLALAALVFWLVFTSMPPVPASLPAWPAELRNVPASRELAATVRRRAIDDFRSTYGNLYRESTPWESFVPACDARTPVRACAGVTWPRIVSLQAHLRSPGTFAQDFCAAVWRAEQRRETTRQGLHVPGTGYALLPLLRLPEPRWRLAPGAGAGGAPVCALGNRGTVGAAAEALAEQVTAVAAGASLLIAVPAWWIARRRMRVA